MATVTFKKGDQVECKSLVEEDDESRPLVEVVPGEEIMPTPPRIHFGGEFGLYNKVYVFGNDGRCVGRITERKGSVYYVYFASTGEEIAYHCSLLGIHLDWVIGNWVSSKKTTPSILA
ncbi:hypothetical protein Tsubulata_012710 [Turnera subulata]|uniref:Agenet domain-containing protein n=1 Tax=Turnera subulata TaxID=218843 RepID=A0A9Q0GHI3_9ROSI|nr:hypothetical protein Tsubulata_012710 [Turnera subulata]